MVRGLLLVIALGGCDIVFHIDAIPAGDARNSGDPIDGQLDGPPPVCTLVGHHGAANAGFIQYCVHTDKQPLDLKGPFDTTANPMCDYVTTNGADANPVCVVSARTISVTTKLVVTGDKPLVLAALDTITITAMIDLTGGGGANPGSCTTAGIGGTGASTSTGGGGGGGGGGWATLGGKGGVGKPGTQASGGAAVGLPVDIRGGCPGGPGGSGPTGTPGQGGHGGGAIYLAAHTAIHVSTTGAIDASGTGGAGGNAMDGGGGGGGAGGLIAFDSPVVTFDFDQAPGAKLWANGGGGGGGGGAVGSNGHLSTDPTLAGMGGSPNGGNGAVGTNNGNPGIANTVSGGGGGGGGQGFIVMFTTSPLVLDSNISPPLVPGS